MKIHNLSKTVITLAVLASMTACSSFRTQDPQPVKEVQSGPQVKDRVTEVAESIDAQLRTLIRLEKGVATESTAKSAKQEQTKEYDILNERVTIKWSGTAEGLVAGISKKIGYEYVPSKVRPSVDTIVNMTVEDMPLRDVLREVGLRLDKTADIHVSKSKKTIAIIYK